MKKLVIFDLDGTILDTLTDLKNSVNYVLKLRGLKEKTTAEIKSYVGNGIEVLMRRALPSDIDDGSFQEAFGEFKKHYEANLQNETKPYPNIMDVLNELKNKELKIAVVSNKFQEGVDQLVKDFFADYVDLAVGTSTQIRPKPEIDSIKFVLKELNINKDYDIYFVGDSEVDIKTAKNANLKIISVTWGFRDGEELSKYNPDYLIDNPLDILDIVLKR